MNETLRLTNILMIQGQLKKKTIPALKELKEKLKADTGITNKLQAIAELDKGALLAITNSLESNAPDSSMKTVLEALKELQKQLNNTATEPNVLVNGIIFQIKNVESAMAA